MSDDTPDSLSRDGDRVRCGARVDDGIYTEFREWVGDQYGEQYANVGRALDRAMLEYMDRDRYARIEEELADIQEQLTVIRDQTGKNEALQRQVLSAVSPENKGKVEITPDIEVPTGKSPGDRREREQAVIRALKQAEVERIGKAGLHDVIEKVAGVSSQKSKESYVESITDTEAFRPETPGVWALDPEGAEEVLAQPS